MGSKGLLNRSIGLEQAPSDAKNSIEQAPLETSKPPINDTSNEIYYVLLTLIDSKDYYISKDCYLSTVNSALVYRIRS